MKEDITMVSCEKVGKDKLINCFGYNSGNKELHIVFKNNKHCVYSNVPKERFQLMACSDSRIAFYIKNIKEKFKENIINE